MARAPRDRSPGIHHVTIAAAGRSLYFHDDVDRLDWIRRFVEVATKFEWICLSFCQMTTHVHLLVETPDESLPFGMQRLNGGFAQATNVRNEGRGTVQRTRYWSERKVTADAMLAAFRYIVWNPVEAGLVRDPLDWQWSSFATSCGLGNAYPFVDAGRIVGELGGDAQALLDLGPPTADMSRCLTPP